MSPASSTDHATGSRGKCVRGRWGEHWTGRSCKFVTQNFQVCGIYTIVHNGVALGVYLSEGNVVD